MITRAEVLWQTHLRLAAALLMFLGTVALAAGCGTSTAPDDGPAMAQLSVQASGASPADRLLVIEVTASDISPALVFNFEIVDGSASGTITLTAGSNRTITARTYDAGAIETRRGSVTVDVHEGSNPTLVMTLMPLEGDQPIDIIFGVFTVTVTPEADTLVVGDTLRLTAVVVDAEADTLDVSVGWATMAPGVAQVDTAGLVTTIAEGEAQIVATYAGIGDDSRLTVTSASPAPPIRIARKDAEAGGS